MMDYDDRGLVGDAYPDDPFPEDDEYWPDPSVCDECGHVDYWCDICGYHGHDCPEGDDQ